MDIGNFFLRNTGFQKFLFQIVIHIKAAVTFRCAEVAEHHLCAALLFRLPPDTNDIPGTHGNLAIGIVRRQRVYETHIQCQLSAVVGDSEHIVHLGVNTACTDRFCPFRQSTHHFLLQIRGLNDLRMEVGLWNRQLQHIRRLNICHLLERGHQFR